MHSPMPLAQPSPKRSSEDLADRPTHGLNGGLLQGSLDGLIRSAARMGTVVTMHVVGKGVRSGSDLDVVRAEEAVARAFQWFDRVEECCTRFDPQSELMQLCGRVGVPVPASTLLFNAVQFALAVADETGGAFDPTVGRAMESRGFNREYRSKNIIRAALKSNGAVNYRDVQVDPARQTITLLRPLLLDLGGVAKGLAVDLAARELQQLENFAINAGGDLYLGGHNPADEPWSIGIRHPRSSDDLIESIRVSNCAVCTSGDYERRVPGASGEHHILDPRTGASLKMAGNAAASVTVIAPNTMLADALATAAFVLGPEKGIELLERLGVDGLIISAESAENSCSKSAATGEIRASADAHRVVLKRHATRGFGDYQ
jgi:thiamine biosynthesis lipoprotein